MVGIGVGALVIIVDKDNKKGCVSSDKNETQELVCWL